MASAYCMKCGASLPPAAQFCAACGASVSDAPSVVPPGAAVADLGTPGVSGFNPPALPLSTLLGLQNTRKFLLQHVLLGPRHSYRVMDTEQRHLFSVSEDVGAERAAAWGRLTGPALRGEPGLHVTLGAMPRSGTSSWVVEDSAQNIQGALTLQIEGGHAVATLADASGAAMLLVNVKRGLASITASATTANGQPVLEARGNLFHHNFSIHDAGGSEVAKIHESYASLRDTYNLDLVGPTDPVFALVFAVLIDHYKGK